jgi:tetraacyldisaccharide 4'-kinase
MRELIKRIITDKDRTWAGAVLKPFLALLSFVYAGIMIVIHALYQVGVLPSYRPQHPVISVGNITAGGVGKTPIVMFLVRLLKDKGFSPVVLTRGYMALREEAGQASDEATMISEKLNVPVMVNPDRVAAARNAQDCAMGNIFILDDGFQHRRLKRDLDVVAIDATNAFGNGYLLPRGVLREPLSVLARADLFILTKVDIGQARVADIRRKLEQIKPGCTVIETVHAPVAVYDVGADARSPDFSMLRDRVVGVCAIGVPGSFEVMLRREGSQVEKMFIFDDHHVYTDEDVRRIMAFCREKKIGKIVTTDKDVVKLRAFQKAFQGVSLFVLEIDIKVVHGQTEFFSRIDRCVNS